MINQLLETDAIIINTIDRMYEEIQPNMGRLNLKNLTIRMTEEDNIELLYRYDNNPYYETEVIAAQADGTFVSMAESEYIPYNLIRQLELIAEQELKPIVFRVYKNWVKDELELAEQVHHALDNLGENIQRLFKVADYTIKENDDIEFTRNGNPLPYRLERNPGIGYEAHTTDPNPSALETLQEVANELAQDLEGIWG